MVKPFNEAGEKAFPAENEGQWGMSQAVSNKE